MIDALLVSHGTKISHNVSLIVILDGGFTITPVLANPALPDAFFANLLLIVVSVPPLLTKWEVIVLVSALKDTIRMILTIFAGLALNLVSVAALIVPKIAQVVILVCIC